MLQCKKIEIKQSFIRLFADGSSISTPVFDVQVTREQLVEDLQTVSNWAYQWKIFNPDIAKKAV